MKWYKLGKTEKADPYVARFVAPDLHVGLTSNTQHGQHILQLEPDEVADLLQVFADGADDELTRPEKGILDAAVVVLHSLVEPQRPLQRPGRIVDTGGGAYVGGSVVTNGGSFVGGDSVVVRRD